MVAHNKRMFEGVHLEVEDLYMLEAFQIEYLPGWVREGDLSAVLWAHPSLERFLRSKCPTISGVIDGIMANCGSASDAQALAENEERLVWTIADMLVYSKCPEAYDRLEFHGWDFREITSIVELDDKIVIDVGAGTGRVTVEATMSARLVFAVEPVTRLRAFIRKRLSGAGRRNAFVVDGFGHQVPLPDDFADVLITSHALGWRLEDELAEFERVIKPSGYIVHCPGTAEKAQREQDDHLRLISPRWGYEFARYEETDGWKRKYWKQV